MSQGAGDHCNPAIATDGTGDIYIVWQENTRGTWDVCLSTSSDGVAWSAPRTITDPNGNQVNPAVATGHGSSGLVAVAWQDDRAGNQEIYAATSTNRFLTAATMRVTSNGTDQTDPAIAIDCEDAVCVLWTDARNVAGSSDTDPYFADVSPGATSTNVLVDDAGTNSDQKEPALGVDLHGFPYIVWTNSAGTTPQVYYCGATYADPVPVVEREIAAAAGGTVGTPPASISSPDDVSVVIPAQACPFDATIRIAPTRNPHGFATESLRIYNFGPSGLIFTQPATVTIPYGIRNTGKVRTYWYDSVTGTFSDQGITDMQDIAVGAGLHALQFKTTHFTPFYLVFADGAEGDSGAGGGCALVHGGHGDIAGYFAPYLAIAAATLLYRRKDMKRRMKTLHGSLTNRR